MATKPPSPPPAVEEAAADFPLGEGSEPIPDDPAVTDPLGHLDDLPGVTETPPAPGAGLPDAPAPEPSPPPSSPPPPAPPATKGA